MRKVDCTVCDGKGWTEEAGWFEASRKEVCPVCGGEGEVELDEEVGEELNLCPRCGGNGEEPESTSECVRCGGSGEFREVK